MKPWQSRFAGLILASLCLYRLSDIFRKLGTSVLPALSQQISRCPLGYNAIERFWAGLEKSWNGYLLDAQETVLKRAGNFIWKGMRATVTMMAGAYEKGVKLAADQVRQLETRLQRSTDLK